MRWNGNIKSDSSGQIIVLTGFVIAVIIIGMGTIINSAAISGVQNPSKQSEESFDYFDDVRDEYGIALMVSSDKGEINPFNTTLMEFEDKMKIISGTHGYFVNFTWINNSYSNITKHAQTTIFFTDGNKIFNDTVTYNLVTGKILYDIMPPGNVYNLSAVKWGDCEPQSGAILLSWTASGDDGNESGTAAASYDIRYNRSEILTLEQFYSSDQYPFVGEPRLSGEDESYLIENLDKGEWHFAIIAIDEAGNPSNLSEPHDVSAYSSEWSPEILNLTAHNGTIFDDSGPFLLDAKQGNNINITFNVTDRENNNVNLTLMVRNRTLLPNDTWDYGEWTLGKNWPMANYSDTPLYYNGITNINESWDYYINVTDNSPSCFPPGKFRSEPPKAPLNYYSIEIPYGEFHSVVINSLDNISDTYIDKQENTIPHNGLKILIDGKKTGPTEYYKRGLIWFNLSEIPNTATIISAKISLYSESTLGSNNVSIYKVYDTWNETSVTWDEIESIGYNPIATSFVDPVQLNWNNWTVTDDVQYYNNPSNNNSGWILITEEANNINAVFTDKESLIPSQNPILYVTYME